MSSLSKWSIVCRCEFRTVCHYHPVLKSIIIQRFSNILYPSIHHVGRCDYICSGLCHTHSHLRKQFQSLIIYHLMIMNHTTMTVGCIFTKAHISNNQKLRCPFLDMPYCTLCDPIIIICFTSQLILLIGNSEDKYCRNTGLNYPVKLLVKTIN